MKKETINNIFEYAKLCSLFSITTGILYQFISLRENLIFFSYSQVINDSVYAVPMVWVFLLSLYISYEYYSKLHSNLVSLWKKCFKVSKWLTSTLLFSLNLIGWIYSRKYGIPYITSLNFPIINNLTLLIPFFFLFILWFNISFHVYSVIPMDKKDRKYVYIATWAIIYVSLLSTMYPIVYKDLCININDKVTHISYMNDKYIFLDNQNILVANKIDWFYRIKECK